MTTNTLTVLEEQGLKRLNWTRLSNLTPTGFAFIQWAFQLGIITVEHIEEGFKTPTPQPPASHFLTATELLSQQEETSHD
jgi:hypothetical protein